MNDWEVISEEASIVIVGSLNPKIFHPEWFINKKIVEEWEYESDDLVMLNDLTQLKIPNESHISVFLNKFSIKTPLETEYLSIKDITSHTFRLLQETPVNQVGMNLTSIIKVNSKEKWKQLGQQLAPQECWKQAATFINDLETDEQDHLGLWELTMNLPRNDKLKGFIRPKIAVLPNSAGEYKLVFNINSHVEIPDSNALTMTEILEQHWDDSLLLAKNITENIMELNLSKKR